MESVGSKWTKEEELQLIKEYNEDKLNVEEIAEIHKRTNSGISSRLVRLGVITHRHLVRKGPLFVDRKIERVIKREKSLLTEDNMRNILNRIEQLENEVSKLKDQIEYWNIKRLD